MARIVEPPAQLEERKGDVDMPDEALLEIALFDDLKRKPNLSKPPGSVRLRSYRKNDVICEHGEMGWSAFYMLTADDAAKINRVAGDSLQVVDVDGEEDDVRRAAVIQLPRPRMAMEQKRGPFAFLWDWLSSDSTEARDPEYIPNVDSPRDVSAANRTANLYEGELFGELSCLHGTPRSATIIASRDCYALEILRTVFLVFQDDPVYRERMQEVTRRRLIESNLRQLPIFSSLSDEKRAELLGKIECRPLEPGTLICDEHEESDCMYVIGSGTVRVLKDVSWLISKDAPIEWRLLHDQLRQCLSATDGARRSLGKRFSDDLRKAVAESKPDPRKLAAGVNELLCDYALREEAELDALVKDRQIGAQIWSYLADVHQTEPERMAACNRRLVEKMYGAVMPKWRDNVLAGDSPILMQNEIREWPALCRRISESKSTEGPEREFWQRLPAVARDAIAMGEKAHLPSRERQIIIDAINDQLTTTPLLIAPRMQSLLLQRQPLPPVVPLVMEFLPAKKRWTEFDYHRWNRALNRLLMEQICPALTRAKHPTMPDRVLVYRAQGEPIGEMGLFQDLPRSSTCVAYNHPENDPKRLEGLVTLFRMSRADFDALLDEEPKLKQHIGEIVAKRQAETTKRLDRSQTTTSASPLYGERGEELGLNQGRQLMLIDLERCTRCDDCVKACVGTHNDGRSRLFLTGPRTDKYLVPNTCRACLDPVCMSNCPVGSIHRGDNNEMVIENWCIGCEQCAWQCPYGAIEMHGISFLPEGAEGWRYSADVGGDGWTKPRALLRGWGEARAPFHNDRLFRESLSAEPKVCHFRLDFRLDKKQLGSADELMLTVFTPDKQCDIWINGEHAASKIERGRGKHGLSGETIRTAKLTFAPQGDLLKPGVNVLAVMIDLGAVPHGGLLLDARLDPKRLWEGQEVRSVFQTAVVCDLCSSVPSGPACISACPHDAAMRVDALADFPGSV